MFALLGSCARAPLGNVGAMGDMLSVRSVHRIEWLNMSYRGHLDYLSSKRRFL
jgi:hypothetical protein